MKIVLCFLCLAAVMGVAALRPALAEEMAGCGTTIDSLKMCVQCCLDMGHIDNVGIGKSLLAKVDAAQAAADRGKNATAIRVLQAFINEVSAQAGKHIDAEHAQHMIMHAQDVIATLQ